MKEQIEYSQEAKTLAAQYSAIGKEKEPLSEQYEWREKIKQDAESLIRTAQRANMNTDTQTDEAPFTVYDLAYALPPAKAKRIVAKVNHADKLAEALRECRMALTLDYSEQTKRNKALCDCSAAASQAHNKAVLALAAYEEAKQ